MSKRFGFILSLAIGTVLLAVLPALAESVDTAWVRRYNGTGNDWDGANAIAVDGSGNVYVTGLSYGSGTGADYATTKYYPNGDTAWTRRYNGPGDSTDWAYAIAVDYSGYVYVTGDSWASGTDADYATMKYYPNGDTVWVRRYNGPGDSTDRAYAIAVDDSGNVYVTGRSIGDGTSEDYATIKYDSSGFEEWVERYNGPGNYWDWANAIAVDDSGYVYVTGESAGAGTYPDFFDYATIKYYPDGDTVWARRYNRADSSDWAYAIAVDPSGNVYVAGGSIGSGTDADYATIKYHPNGDAAWVKRYNGPDDDQDWATDLALDGSGNVYVTGRSWATGVAEDYVTIKYYPDGDTAWVRRYDGPGNGEDHANALVVDDSGNIYVTGDSDGGEENDDYATIKYYSNGDTAWVRRYNGPGDDDDEATAIAVDGSGNVYLTGGSDGGGTGGDYATIKYVQGISYVSVTDDAFIPQSDTITVGDSVRWTNNGAVPHTSTSDTKSSWDSGTLDPGESFTFQFESDGVYPYHCTFHPSMAGTIVVLTTDVKDETGDREKPSEFSLSQNYPNPFNQATNIEFTLAKSGFVSLNIYDILGRKVRTLVSERLPSGYKSVLWDGKNDSGKDVASGIYFYQIKVENPAPGGVGDFTETKKLVLLK